MKISRLLHILPGCILLFVCGFQGANGQDGVRWELGKKIDKVLSAKQLSKASVGVKVVRLNDDATVYEKNSTRLFSVASNMKIATTAAALVCLGKDYEFKTRFLRRGVLAASTLKGDLVVIGTGDPCISSRFYDSPIAVFQSWAKMLAAQGVERVEGDILIDDTFFDREFIPRTWPKEQLHRWYCAPVSAVCLNDNCIDITVSPGAGGGKPALFSLSPPTNYATVKNTCITTSRKSEHMINLYRKQGSMEVKLSGKFFTGSSPQTFFITVDSPPLFWGTVLKETLEGSGIVVTGTVKLLDSALPENSLIPIAAHSQTLQTVLPVTNKNSQNLFAEILLKTLGRNVANSGSLAGGVKALEEFFAQLKIGKSNFAVADGCGLSEESKLTPDAIVRILAYMHKEKFRDEFKQSLAVSGIDGTLERRFTEAAYKGRVFGKTGYIRGASALSGYAESSSGKTFAFTIIFNNAASLSNTYMKSVQDEIVKVLLTE
jgi:D-alanyl-D-alanine carboxypeptidase/D-alanyl-D-alanine-endopeptidase (penicillin-binding protein 4)